MRSRRRPRGLWLMVCGLALVAAVVSGVYVHRYYRNAAIGEAFTRLTLFHGLRKATLEDYMRSKASDVRAMSRNRKVTEALAQFAAAWREVGADPPAALRRLYVDSNPFQPGQRGLLLTAGDGSAYTRVHAGFHDWARRFLEHFGYKDLFLIDPQGNILYSTGKNDDFATSLDSGPYEASALGYVFHQARRQGGGRVALSDLEDYGPGGGAPSAFAGSAVQDRDGKITGIFAVRFTGGPIDEILRYVAGMGSTGQTYIVGNDFLMRSQSRFDNQPTSLVREVDTAPARAALNGFSGSQIAVDYRGVEVLSVYSALDFGGPPWVLLAEMEESEVLDKVRLWPALIVALIAAAIAAAAAHIGYRLRTGT